MMQYVWEHRLWQSMRPLRTVDGRSLQIIDPGIRNNNAGPDFFNAKVAIDGKRWVGDVEIHVKASDWFRHEHHVDKAYNSVILHVVDIDDDTIERHNGEVIPQFEMKCSGALYDYYCQLVDNAAAPTLRCGEFVSTLPKVYIVDWLETLAFERLDVKSGRIKEVLDSTNGDFDQAAFVILSRSMGSGINGEPFERMAKSLPLKILQKHVNSLPTIEALLFGQAGLLNEECDVPYYNKLVEEYRFLTKKYELHQVESPGWKMSRMRPQNFPHRRIALLADLIYNTPRFASQLTGIKSLEEAKDFFSRGLTGFWSNHYTFSSDLQAMTPSALSISTVNSLVINAVVPLKYVYGMYTSNEALMQEAVDLLAVLPRENNSIVNIFCNAGLDCDDALTSQAFIELRNEYCLQRKCLFCRIGHRWLSQHAIRANS